MGDVEVTGDEVSVRVGDTVAVRLPENATTGYVWSVTTVDDGLALESDARIPPAQGTPGAGGQHLVRLRAERAGTWRVGLRLARPWEPTASEERGVTVTVV